MAVRKLPFRDIGELGDTFDVPQVKPRQSTTRSATEFELPEFDDDPLGADEWTNPAVELVLTGSLHATLAESVLGDRDYPAKVRSSMPDVVHAFFDAYSGQSPQFQIRPTSEQIEKAEFFCRWLHTVKDFRTRKVLAARCSPPKPVVWKRIGKNVCLSGKWCREVIYPNGLKLLAARLNSSVAKPCTFRDLAEFRV